MKTVSYWIVQDPDGHLLVHTVSIVKKTAQRICLSWKQSTRERYKVIEVQIKPIRKKKVKR